MTNEEIAIALNDHHNEIGSLKHRMDAAEDNIHQIHELVTCVRLLAQKQDDLIKNVSSLHEEVKDLKAEPAKRWNNATQTIVSGVISAAVAAICAVIINLV